jgi:16S rRNA G527 N7-methylase RsmG
MNTWVGDCHSISAEDLGKVLARLEELCPQCLVKRAECNEVEVNVDLVTGRAFRETSLILRLPEGVPRRKPRRVVDSVLKR